MLRNLLVVLFSAVAALAQPRVTKVEPPNWWAGHSMNPVRLLIRGDKLCGARIEAAASGLRTSRISCNAAGSYLFADLEIARNTKPGSYPLRLITAEGTTEFAFRSEERRVGKE